MSDDLREDEEFEDLNRRLEVREDAVMIIHGGLGA